MKPKIWKSIVVCINDEHLPKFHSDINSHKNWYLLKLLSGVLSNNVYIHPEEYRRLFILEKYTTIIKLVDDVGGLRKL